MKSFLLETNRLIIEGKIVDEPIANRFSFRVGDDREQPEE